MHILRSKRPGLGAGGPGGGLLRQYSADRALFGCDCDSEVGETGPRRRWRLIGDGDVAVESVVSLVDRYRRIMWV
jgi:hypothetical protein